jgi:hypothetical protein
MQSKEASINREAPNPALPADEEGAKRQSPFRFSKIGALPEALWVPVLLFPLFWFFRSSTFRGDGDQICRLIEGGEWFWAREMLSQAILQLSYRILQVWHWDGMMTMNLVSCLSGCIFFACLIQLAKERWGGWKLPVLLFLGSGFVILFCGHTEYYPISYAAAGIFLYLCHRYLEGRGSLLGPALAFSLLCWTHLLGLFVVPALVYLWWTRGRSQKDLVQGLIGLSPLVALYLLIVYDPFLWRTKGELLGDRLLPPFDFNSLGTQEKYYTFFSWTHLHDIFFWIQKTSPLLLPMAFTVFFRRSARESFLRNRYIAFLWISGLLWLGFTLVWHPDFTIYQDWDLFSIAALPLTLLFLEHWMKNGWTRHRMILPAILLIGCVPTWTDVSIAAKLGQRGRGHLRIVNSAEDLGQTQINIDGHLKSPVVYNLIEGDHYIKVISLERGRVFNRIVRIEPGQWTEVRLDWSKARRLDRPSIH